MRFPSALRLGLPVLLAAAAAGAQPQLTFPQASPKASVSQTVGLTDITISYHRPAVNKRKVWGGLVVWDSLAECYATMGDKRLAIENYTKALGMTADPAQKKRINDELAKLKT